VEGDERLRLFVGLPLPADARDRLAVWARTAIADPEGARLVPPENLHLTLAFLGSRPRSDVEPIVAELREAARDARRPLLRAVRYRETRSVGMVVLEDEGDSATALASDVARRLEALGVYTPERRGWLPHVTVLRFRTPPRLRLDAPDLGEVSPSEAALYHSVLRRTGAQYEIRESVPLGG
jgi:RNA 2',3'-cyclic 3'-phosphodiesterase